LFLQNYGCVVLGLMMDRQLTLTSILEFAARNHGEREIVTQTVEGPVHRYGYSEALVRSKQLAKALLALGVTPGDRVATLAWSTFRHFELYYAVPGIGAILHTINPRLHPDQVAWIINQAGDSVLLFDRTFVGLLNEIAGKLHTVKSFVALGDGDELSGLKTLSYELLLSTQGSDFDWPQLREDQASALCYTSGTTGNPKGVLYSHRSTVLRALTAVAPDCLNLSAADTILPCAQMYHANAWGVPYAAPLVGAKLVLPGRELDGRAIARMAVDEAATVAIGVPTIWVGLLDHLERTGIRLRMHTAVVGGSAPTAGLVTRMEDTLGARVCQGWGMTETSAAGVFNSGIDVAGEETPGQVLQRKLLQGRALWGVELRLVDDAGKVLPHNGLAPGFLQVRGPLVASGYFAGEGKDAFTEDGWFNTGDIGTIDEKGFLRLTDRAKDVIKSGGEWISSLDLENAVSSHPSVALAAAIGMPDPKWDERPLLLVVLRETLVATPDELRDYVAERVAKWWIPDEVRIVDTLPIGPTGKVIKRDLRQMLAP
jgi:fatty-acyl-CoA synthase